MSLQKDVRVSEMRKGKIYGRSTQIKELCEAILCEAKDEAHVVFVVGASGSGKSALMKETVCSIEKSRLQLTGYGKFTEQGYATKPYEALSNCLIDVCDGIINNKDDLNYDYASSLKEELNEEQLSVLAGLVPNLSDIVPIKEEWKSISAEEGGSKESLEKLKYALRIFIKVVSQPDHPVVLCLDDLQWIDPSTFNILKAVIAGSSPKDFVLVCSYRDNEVDNEHVLTKWIDQMKVKPKQIQVGNLNSDEITILLNDILKTEDTEDFATLLHARTNGNILHILQLLDYLEEEKLLQYRISKFCWTWNIDEIRSRTNVNDTVADLLKARIELLDDNEKTCLSLCSCLGFRIDEPILSMIRDVVPDRPVTDLSASLQTLCQHGLIERLSDAQLKFVHDKIYHAALNSIDGKRIEELSFAIGRKLLTEYSLEKSSKLETFEDRVLFVCTEQLNRSQDLIDDPKFRVKLARLNAAIAKRAASFSAFLPAARYLASGIEQLNEKTMWKNHYSLSLELFTSMAEMSYCAGNSDMQNKAIDQVLTHANTVDDKFRAWVVRSQWQTSEGNTLKANETSFQILAALGEKIPKRPTVLHKRRGFSRLKKQLSSMTNDEILALPPIEDRRNVQTIKVLCDMVMATYNSFKGNPYLSPVLMCAMAQRCIDFGFCSHSAVAFSCVAVHFANEGDCDTARRLVELSEVLVRRPECRATRSRVCFFQYLASHWWRPLSQMTDLCIEGYHTGMQSGDVFYAFLGVCRYIYIYFYSGLPLRPLVADSEEFLVEMVGYRQKLLLLHTLPLCQCAVTLTEGAGDLTDLSGRLEKHYRSLLEWDGKSGVQTEDSLKMQIAFYGENLELATKMYEGLKDVDMGMFKGSYFVQARIFFFALICLSQYRETGMLRWKRALNKYFKTMQAWVTDMKSNNCAHKLLILKAEMKSLGPKVSSSDLKDCYDVAISASAKAGFLQDAALGSHLASFSIQDESSSYFSKALEFYSSWGATPIADYLRNHHGSSHDSRESSADGQQRGRVGYRSRARYDKSVAESHKTLEIRNNKKVELIQDT